MNHTSFFKCFFLAGALVLSSCDKIIDVKPVDQLDASQALATIEDHESALLGVYAQLRSRGYYSRDYLALPEMMSDNLRETIESLANYVQETNWIYAADNLEVENAWAAPYTLINRANILINSIEGFKDSGQKNRILGQALALRAFAHFDLLRFYGQSYDRNSTALGVVVKKESNLAYPPRNTVKETYDAIFGDLLQAKTLLASIDRPVNNRNYIDATAVSAMLARVSLYAKQYDDAVTYAGEAITGSSGLTSRADFPKIWSDDAGFRGEVIWSIAFNAGEPDVAGWFWDAPFNRNSFIPSASLTALYDQTNDIRFQSYIGQVPGRTTGITTVVAKYLGKGTARDGVVDAKVFRAGEMYLIRAEAHALKSTPNFQLSLLDLNTLRNARIASAVDLNLTGNALVAAIADERRRELAFEGHRWFDLRRTGQPINRGADCVAPARSCQLPANSPKFVWPIPQNEIINNPAMKDQQNPGYN